MRITLNLDPDVLAAARRIAAARSVSLGKAVSDLARCGLEASTADGPEPTLPAFPVFEVGRGAAPLTPEDVQRDEDEA